MAILLEGLEYFWIALHLETDDVYFKNIITGFRILMVIGFWLGVRYGRRPLRDVKRPDHALGLAAEGYLGFLSNILRHPWRLFRAGYQRVRSWHTEKRD